MISLHLCKQNTKQLLIKYVLQTAAKAHYGFFGRSSRQRSGGLKPEKSAVIQWIWESAAPEEALPIVIIAASLASQKALFFRSPVQRNTFLCLPSYSESFGPSCCGADVSLVWVWTFIKSSAWETRLKRFSGLLSLLHALKNKGFHSDATEEQLSSKHFQQSVLKKNRHFC